MPKKTVDEVLEDWGKNLKASTTKIKREVEKVSEAPSSLAIEQQAKMLANLIEAIESGAWAKGLEGYSLSQWKKDMIEKGIPRISKGVDNAEPKMRKFIAWLLQRVEAGQAKLEDMPSMTLDDNIERMVTYVRHMADEKYKRSR